MLFPQQDVCNTASLTRTGLLTVQCVHDRHEDVPAPAQSCTSLHRPVPLKLADPSALQTLSKAHKAGSSRSSHSSPQQSAEDADEYVMSLLRDASHSLLHSKAQSQQQLRQQAHRHPVVSMSKRKRSAAAAKPPDKKARRCLATDAVAQLGSAPWQQARELLMSQQQQFAQQVSSQTGRTGPHLCVVWLQLCPISTAVQRQHSERQLCGLTLPPQPHHAPAAGSFPAWCAGQPATSAGAHPAPQPSVCVPLGLPRHSAQSSASAQTLGTARVPNCRAACCSAVAQYGRGEF